MRKIFIGVMSVLCMNLYAQKNDSVNVLVPVADAFTGKVIENGKVEVLALDSTFIAEGQWSYSEDNGVRTETWLNLRVPSNGRYLLRLTQNNYFTTYQQIVIERSKRAGADDYVVLKDKIKMRKRPDAMKDKQLGEAVVTATKIKMVMKGDTIVYNADAFQLSKGSMLDALIEQLPGAELKDNGVITVNGKQVSSLLVNGKDFFRGDPKVALENLPAYMVNKVKVYEKETDFEKFSGIKERERPLVMDVNLKKQYSIGWIANAEAAYGTKDKYIGRLFALRFTDCSRIAMYGNINNTNDTRRAGSKGDWTPSSLPEGVQTSRTGGAEYYYENRKKTLQWTSNLTVSDVDNNTSNFTNSESFLPSNNFYSQSKQNGDHDFTTISTNHEFVVNKAGRHKGGVNFYGYKNSANSLNLYGGFNSDPYALVQAGALDSLFMPGNNKIKEIAQYRRREQSMLKGKYWSVTAPYNLWLFPFQNKGISDFLLLNVVGSYDKYTHDAFNTYNLQYLNGTSNDEYRNRYQPKTERHYNYSADLTYLTVFGDFQPSIMYGYSQDYRSGRDELYRLDKLDNWSQNSNSTLGTLPSASSELQDVLDLQNSVYSSLWKRLHQLNFEVRYRNKAANNTEVTVALPVNIELDHLLYNRSGRHFDLHRTKPLFMANGVMQQVFRKEGAWECVSLRLNYNFTRRQPDLVKTLDVVDDSNPLYIQNGNSGLKTTAMHNVMFEIYVRQKRTYRFNFSYNRTHNALATERTFVPTTGGYIVRPVNVNGNWTTDGKFNITHNLGKKKLFTLSNSTSYTFSHSVDMANIAGSVNNALSTIKNLYLHEQLSLDYSKNGWNIGAKARASYSHLAGNRADFNTINAWDYNYGITARIPIPGGIGLSTDFTIFSRRGYDDPSLNSDDVVWNMRLERSVLNGNLTFAVDGFDILHNLSKVTRTVNAQGRIESYSNVLPSYFMAHVIYKLNIQPKKKK